MDAIQAARELGKAIQADERYIKMRLHQQKSDEDTALQEQIASFTQKRAELNMAMGSSDKDPAALQEMNNELQTMYKEIFQNEHMAAMNQANSELNEMLAFVNQIITGSAQGENPETIQYQASCGGDCGGCSGCH